MLALCSGDMVRLATTFFAADFLATDFFTGVPDDFASAAAKRSLRVVSWAMVRSRAAMVRALFMLQAYWTLAASSLKCSHSLRRRKRLVWTVDGLSFHISLSGHLTLGGRYEWIDRHVPWQQLFEAVDGMVRDACEDVVKIEFRVKAVEFG